jgi:solute carrier family 25 protein 42
MAGAFAKTAIAPLDRIKILFQTDPNRAFSMASVREVSNKIYSSAGYRAFWKGHTATLLRVVPYSATNFYVFDRARYFLENPDFSIHPVLARFAAGAFSGSVAVIVTYPFETLRARLAVDLIGRYSGGYVGATRTIVRAEGIRRLYSGLRPTLIGIIPYAGTSFAVYETLKGDQRSFHSRLLVGAIAGFVAQAATYPLDVVRRRMQVTPWNYKSVTSTFKAVYIQEGIIHGLYKGLSMNLLKGPIAVGISLNVNDHMKDYFARSHES